MTESLANVIESLLILVFQFEWHDYRSRPPFVRLWILVVELEASPELLIVLVLLDLRHPDDQFLHYFRCRVEIVEYRIRVRQFFKGVVHRRDLHYRIDVCYVPLFRHFGGEVLLRLRLVRVEARNQIRNVIAKLSRLAAFVLASLQNQLLFDEAYSEFKANILSSGQVQILDPLSPAQKLIGVLVFCESEVPLQHILLLERRDVLDCFAQLLFLRFDHFHLDFLLL